LENAKEIKISESFIKQLHGLLLKYSAKDIRPRGEYKTLPNSLTANYPDGTTRIIFDPTPPYLVKKEMEFFIDCLLELIQKLEKKYAIYRKKGAYLNERQKRLVSCIKKRNRSKSAIFKRS